MKLAGGLLHSIYSWEEDEDSISLKDLSVNLKNTSVKVETKGDDKESRSTIVSATVRFSSEPVNNEIEWSMCAIAPLWCNQEQKESRSMILSPTNKQEPVHNDNEQSMCAIAPLWCNQEHEESRSMIVSPTIKQEPVHNENEPNMSATNHSIYIREEEDTRSLKDLGVKLKNVTVRVDALNPNLQQIPVLERDDEVIESRSNIASPTVRQEPVNNENALSMSATDHSIYTWEEEEDNISLKDLSRKLKKVKDKNKALNPNLHQIPVLERDDDYRESRCKIVSPTVRQKPVINNENELSMPATAPLQCYQEQDESEDLSSRAEKEVTKIFLCEICNKGFLKDSVLKSHLETHGEDEQFSCDICKANFPQKYELKIHRYTHDKVKTYSCDMCGKVFLQSSLLENHISTHLEYKRFQCKRCPKQFITMGNLKTHVLMHSKNKSFSCHLCDKTFTQKGNLKTHLLTHSGSQPYECNICHKKFTQRGNLQHHVFTHADKKPFSCEFCGKTFAQKGNLKTHRLSNHSAIMPRDRTLRTRKSKTR